ncbi:O-antigen polymerase [Eubacteriaceae bacterium ES3]|nr:O-antigen polymerase [Eubacteriaceae bacterium ES3]
MYSFITILVCTITVTYLLFGTKHFYHPLLIFNVCWAFILFLESFHFYELYKSSESIYWYILCGVLAINIGFFVWDYRRKRNKTIFKIGRQYLNTATYSINIPRYKMLYVLAILCIIYYLGSVILTFYYLYSGISLAEIRSIVQDSTSAYNLFNQNKFLNAISILFLVPGAAVVQVVGAMDFWFGKREKKLFFLAVILAVMSSIGEGGRTSLVNMCIYMLLGYYLSGVSLKNKAQISVAKMKKRKRLILGAVTIGVIFLIWFSVSRAGQTLYKELYLYFSMQPYMFDIWAKRADLEGIFGYGETSLNGFSFAVLYIFKNLFGIDFPTHWQSVYDLIRATDSEWQIITATFSKANAYVGIFWFFYVDGRLFGILIGMFLYGVYLAHSYNDAIKYTNVKTAAIYSFIFQGLVWSFIRFPFSNIYYAIAFLMLIFLAFKSVKREV